MSLLVDSESPLFCSRPKQHTYADASRDVVMAVASDRTHLRQRSAGNDNSSNGSSGNSSSSYGNEDTDDTDDDENEDFDDDHDEPSLLMETRINYNSSSSSSNNNINNNSNPSRRFVSKFQLMQQFSSSFISLLSTSPCELWKAYLLKLLDSYAYFSFSLVFTLFLSDDFNFTDVQAGAVYGAWGALITIFGLITGSIIDNWGVAKCLRLGFTISFISRLTLLLTTSKTVLLVCLLFTLPLGNCLGIPVLTVGVRRYTTKANRGFAFGLFYVIMNLGALVAGPLVDTLTFHYNNNAKTSNEDDSDDSGGNNSTTTIDDGSIIDINDEEQITAAWKMTISRAIIMSGVCTSFIAVLIAFTIREIKVESEDDDSCDYSKQETNDFSASMDADMHNDDSNSINNDSDKNNDDDVCPNDRDENKNMVSKKVINNTSNSSITEFQPRKGSPFQIISETIRTPNFRRFLLLTLLTINVKMVFRHLDATLPKYMLREFGENTPKGKVYAINPLMIIILVPIITAATSSVDPLIMIHIGTYVSALSVFFLAFSTSLWACIMFVITLSIGESLWSPRLYDYTTSIAEEGREGTYMALSSAPFFLAKLPVGLLSGVLLQKYCPETLDEENGEVRHSKTMWLIIGLSTICSPILITLLWGYLSGGDRAIASRRNSDDNNTSTNIEMEYPGEKRILCPADRPLPNVV